MFKIQLGEAFLFVCLFLLILHLVPFLTYKEWYELGCITVGEWGGGGEINQRIYVKVNIFEHLLVIDIGKVFIRN